MFKKQYNVKEVDSDWAEDLKGNKIHISNANSGLKGYYCLACKKEMQAVVNFKNPKYKPFFRHHANNIDKSKVKCVVASIIYRERLAEQILHRLKELTVPDVIKFPPLGVEGASYLIKEKEVIKAYKVKSQLSFYENEKSEVFWGKNPEIDKKYLLIRPDISFFDKEGNPILLVEFVVTHKIDDEKKIKLKRLGINTVQIIIPKLPEEEIEKSLKSVRKIKWVYNEDEANASYVSVSKGNSKRVLFIDEEQKRIFTESFSCKSAQINDAIRRLRRCLQSEHYRSTERNFELEISRVERNTERIKERLELKERVSEQEVYSRFEKEFKYFESRGRGIRADKAELEKKYNKETDRIEGEKRMVSTNAEEYSRKNEIVGPENEIRSSYNQRSRSIREGRERNRRIKEELSGFIELERERIKLLEDSYSREFKRDRDRTRRIFKGEERLVLSDIKREREQIQSINTDKGAISDEFRKLEESEQSSFNDKGDAFERETGEVESKISGFELYVKQEEEKLRKGFEEKSIRGLGEGNSNGGREDELSKRIETLYEIRRISSNYNEAFSTYERYRKALKFVRSRAFEEKYKNR